MKFIDLFGGIGGFRRGLELCGHECVGFCELDKFAIASYTSMHLITEEQRRYLETLDLRKRQKEILKEEYRNGEWYANDIRRVYAGDIPEADCWCFGFPCQDISVAGKQLGFTGNRSSLFFRVMYLLGQLEEEKRPAYLFIENVKNLLSVNGGWDFARLLIEMDRVGYDAEWQILNSKYFGVPQNRERCFIIGHLRGRSTAKVFPVEGTDGTDYLHGMINIVGHRDGYRRNMQVFDPEGVTETLDTAQGGGRGHHTIEVVGDLPYTNGKSEQRTGIYGADGIAGTLLSTMYKEPDRVAIPVLTPDRAQKRQNGRRFKEDGEESFTLTSQDRHGVAVGVDDLYAKREPRFYDEEVPTLRSDRYGLKVAVDVKPKVKDVIDDQGRMNKRCTITDTAPTLRSESHGNQPKAVLDVEVKEATKQGYSICMVGRDSVNFTMPGSKTRRGRVGVDMANTLDTSCNQGIFVQISEDLTVYAVWYPKKQCYISIRKLTPKECFRLQGWSDDYFEKAQFVNSDSQLYKQAGNGVTVNVVQAIGSKMKINREVCRDD